MDAIVQNVTMHSPLARLRSILPVCCYGILTDESFAVPIRSVKNKTHCVQIGWGFVLQKFFLLGCWNKMQIRYVVDVICNEYRWIASFLIIPAHNLHTDWEKTI